ncbi:MAG: heme lyase CcmF/NrfE family subunit [Paracoccaceae bacterium]|nr:heme lyase CcmF/NrfE family subunit [Paracoccaceae bacterium]
MLIEIGHLSLIMALSLSTITAIAAMVGSLYCWINWERLACSLVPLTLVLISISFFSLVYGFIVSDFSVRVVFENSHSSKPLIYKISGTWGNHEGSMLLWVLLLSFFASLIIWFGKNLDQRFKTVVVGVQTSILVMFLSFLIFTSNPFSRILVPQLEGKGLNPVLQDPGLAFHPPFLYLGYVGLSVSFSFAIAALLLGKIDSVWARWVRPWTLLAWIFLTIGIALGSWWAYYELGWGGWWFWDPVENASFMPWLTAVALLHSAIVAEKRESLKNWTVLLAIIAFSFSLIGTFIVRSGVLTSVHSFAIDPTRGVWLLIMITFVIGGALTLYAIRSSEISSNSTFSLMSRESSVVSNNLLLMVSTMVVFVGTIWPLMIEIVFGEKVSVGAPFFNKAFTPFMVLLAMLMPLGAVLPWRKAVPVRSLGMLYPIFFLSLLFGYIAWELQNFHNLIAPVGIFLSLWVVLGTWNELFSRIKPFSNPASITVYRILNIRGSEWGKIIAHSGFGLIIFGISTLTAWEKEDIRVASLGVPYDVGSYMITLDNVSFKHGPNYVSTYATVIVENLRGNYLTTMNPEKRFFPTSSNTTTEAAIDNSFFRDLYIVLGEKQAEGSWVIRTYIKPFINWIWLGACILSIGGLISLLDKRLRLGVASKRKLLQES